MPARNESPDRYRENAEAFITRTEAVDTLELYRTFLHGVPSGGRIMDLCCAWSAAR